MTTALTLDEVTQLLLASRSVLRKNQNVYHQWIRCGHPSEPPCEHKDEMVRAQAADDAAFGELVTALHRSVPAGWYDSRANLAVLFDWLGDLSPSGFRHVIEKPWAYEGEFKAAIAAQDHERESQHQVLKDGMSEERAYCDGCGWNYDDGQVFWVCPFCETRCEEPDDVERRAHLGCLADVAHDEQVAHEAAAR